VYRWVEGKPTNKKGEPIQNYASYLAPALDVSPSRINQLYSAGRAFCLGLSGVTDRKMLAGLTEAHLRPLATVAHDDKKLDAVVADLLEQTEEGETPTPKLVKQCVNHALGKKKPVEPEEPEEQQVFESITRAFTRLRSLLVQAGVSATVGNKLTAAHASFVTWKEQQAAKKL
jgi:hypothetical protein